ncbi:SymE family type I addiction module toxin [Pseudomonas aeruginosa]|uniref:SymE family type I addiction module toxin n=1 Tax=Pseudomonas aeruginosa TaxID=287 RepID=UPI003D9C2DEA
MNSAENVRRCLLIRHLSHGEDFRLNRCPGSVDHYNWLEAAGFEVGCKVSIQVTRRRLVMQVVED